MPELIFLGGAEPVQELEFDEDPVHIFPCMHTRGLHIEARAQLYALVSGSFFDEALEMESLHRSLTEEGPTIHQLDPALVRKLGALDEQDIGEVVSLWGESREVEAIEMDTDDLLEYVYLLVNLCQAAANEDELGVYVYSDL